MVDLDRGRGVLVALHGHDDDPGTARSWGRRMAPPGWEVVAPGAPRDDEGVRSWFPAGPRGVDAEELDRAVRRTVELVDRLRAGGRPVVLAGFSQGAAVVAATLLAGVRCAAAVTVAGFLPEPDRGELGSGPCAVDRLLSLHGEHDEVVPDVLASGAAEVLAAVGISVDRVSLPVGHEVGPTVTDAARSWLTRSLRPGPKVSLGLPVERVDTDLCTASGIVDVAAGYERLGFDAAYVTDHPAPDRRWLDAGGHHALEPTVALAVAATATSQLLLHTNVYVLGYRNPFMAAKAIASLDVVADGRLILGVAAGYLRPEFAAVGRDPDRRGALLDEALDLLPRIWSGEVVEGAGEGWSARAVVARPRPVRRPHPPIWVGGNSTAAMRRAARHAQGWSPFPTPGDLGPALGTAAIRSHDDLRSRLERFHAECDDVGRTERPETCFVPFSLAAYLDDPAGGAGALGEEVEALAELGVDWVALMSPGRDRSEVLDHAAGLADLLGR